MIQTFNICPVAKPRMTQQDKWIKRPEVMRYRAYCVEVRLNRIQLSEEGQHIRFVIPMPASWSKRKRAELNGKPHRQKPDVDNLHKGLMDAILDDDSGVWDVRISKVWGETGCIEIIDSL